MIRLGVFAVVAGICCLLSGCSGNSSAPEMNETSSQSADWGGDEADDDVEMALDVPDPDDL